MRFPDRDTFVDEGRVMGETDLKTAGVLQCLAQESFSLFA